MLPDTSYGDLYAHRSAMVSLTDDGYNLQLVCGLSADQELANIDNGAVATLGGFSERSAHNLARQFTGQPQISWYSWQLARLHYFAATILQRAEDYLPLPVWWTEASQPHMRAADRLLDYDPSGWPQRIVK